MTKNFGSWFWHDSGTSNDYEEKENLGIIDVFHGSNFSNIEDFWVGIGIVNTSNFTILNTTFVLFYCYTLNITI